MVENYQYWIVGATLAGHSALTTFLNRGYWQLGMASKPKRDPLYMERFAKILLGDRIAVKSLVGKGTGRMAVKAIGIVKEIVPDERKVYVSWVMQDFTRAVDLHGCMDAINGPYLVDGKNEDWINRVFRI